MKHTLTITIEHVDGVFSCNANVSAECIEADALGYLYALAIKTGRKQSRRAFQALHTEDQMRAFLHGMDEVAKTESVIEVDDTRLNTIDDEGRRM